MRLEQRQPGLSMKWLLGHSPILILAGRIRLATARVLPSIVGQTAKASAMACERAHSTHVLACTILIAAAAWSVPFPALSDALMGYKGDRLRGSISCIHPNMIHDLIDRVGEAENYTVVLRTYVQQGYCFEGDIPTILVKPMADRTFRTWDGYEAEIWETILRLDHGDGTSETLKSHSIVFPREMEQSFNN